MPKDSFKLDDADHFRDKIAQHLRTSQGKDPEHATPYDWRMALSLALRDLK